MKVPLAYLIECLTYDPESGNLFWKVRPKEHFPTENCWRKSNTLRAGRPAGNQHFCRGLRHAVKISITISGVRHELHAHNIIFALMGIEIPAGMIVDHKDDNPFNNAWENLRLATISQNAQNKVGKRIRIHKLPKGVYRNGNKYVATICKDGNRIPLGKFPTPEQAHAAYKAKALQLFGEFARFN